MIRSMTAYARTRLAEPWGELECELRSVNHRYLEPNFRLPDLLRPYEPILRERLRKRVGRGKVDCSFRLQMDEVSGDLEIDTAQVERIVQAARQIGAISGSEGDLNALEILQMPGVRVESELDAESLEASVLAAFEETLDDFLEGRAREGTALTQAILDRISQLEQQAGEVRSALPTLLEAQQSRIRERLETLSESLEAGRLEAELVMLAQRMDVEEELDRLDTHLAEVRNLLQESRKPVGRKLDFLAQEMNREVNTLGSKSLAGATTEAAVEMKVLLEQVREQIQNIE